MLAYIGAFAVWIVVVVLLWLSVMRPAIGNVVLWSAIILGTLVLTGFTLWGIIS